MAELRLLFPGQPRVERDGIAVPLRRRKVLALLAYLSITAQPHSRDELAELLFPRQDRDRAYSDLRQSLSYLRNSIGESWIESDSRTVSFRRLKGMILDTVEFRGLLKRAGANLLAPDGGIELLAKAARLYRGSFLSGFYLKDSPAYEQWQTAQEESLRLQCTAALERLINAHDRRGDLACAIEWARAAIDVDPLAEGSHRRLMLLLAAAGQRAQALRHYDRCRAILSESLGGEPEVETEALRQEILAGSIAVTKRPAAPIASPKAAPGAPPAPQARAEGLMVVAFSAGEQDAARTARRLQSSGGAVTSPSSSEVEALFSSSAAALAAALKISLLASRAARQPTGERRGKERLPYRIAIHAGETGEAGRGSTQPLRQRALSLLRAAHEGQVPVTGAAASRASDELPQGVTLRHLGSHRLDDLGPPLSIQQLVHPKLHSRFPPLKTLEARPGNLRTQPTLLIGRDRELEAVTSLVRREEVRIVTLTGPGGIGKTRLGLHAAARLAWEFANGACFVDLAVVREPSHLASAIASSVGLREPPGDIRPFHAVLLEHLGHRKMLLVLDNFEHLMPAAPRVAEIAHACAGVKLIVTSRERLHLQGEHEIPVPPLAPASSGDECEAVHLFTERARAVYPEFTLTAENAPIVADICERVDGLPLAIELAAAWIKILPLPVIRERLAQRLQLLTRGASDLPNRQRTLRTEIAWSCDLLEPDEKRLFRRLAVFPGGCALEAAEVVCREPRALDLMASLVDKNLVRRQRADGCERFRMLETIREFASEQLEESNEAAETRRQFTGWALHVAEDAERGLFGAEQIRCFDRLEAERDNLGEALALLYAQRRAGEGTQLSGAMGWFWFRRGHFTLGAYWLERFLAIRDATVEPAVSARAEYYLGYMRLMLGRTFSGNTAAGECFRKSLELWREARNTHREAWQRI